VSATPPRVANKTYTLLTHDAALGELTKRTKDMPKISFSGQGRQTANEEPPIYR
jgi:hypothetical protein